MNRLPDYLIKQNASVSLNETAAFIYKSREESRHDEEYYLTRPLIAYVIEGVKTVHMPEGVITVARGDMFCARKGLYIFSDTEPGRRPFESLLIFPDDAALSLPGYQSRPSAEDETGRPYLKIGSSDELHLYMAGLKQYLAGSYAGNSDLMRIKLEELFHLLLSGPKAGEIRRFFSATDVGRKSELSSFIESHCFKRLTLEEMAELSGRSLSAFKREFITAYGESPGAYLRKKRLEKAKYLLEEGGYSVSETCFRVGFESLSHFSRIYKEQYGFSPSSDLTRNRQQMD